MATSVVDGNGDSAVLVVTEFRHIKELVRQLELHLHLGGASPDLCKHLALQINSLTERSISLIINTRLNGARKRSAGADHPANDGEEAESSSNTSSSSSRSGTIVSTTCTSGASSLSSGNSMEAALLLDLGLMLSLGTPDKKDTEFGQPIKKTRIQTEELLKEKRMKHIESLVQEFFGAPSANLSNGGGNMNVLESWFMEMGVSWVLKLDVGASASVLGHPLVDDTGSWIRALTQIMETIHLTESFFPEHGHGFVGMSGTSEEEEVQSQEQSPIPLKFAHFFKKPMSRMIVLVSKSLSIHGFLEKIMQTTGLTDPNRGHGFLGMPGTSKEEIQIRNQSPDLLQFARFFQKAMSKMLVFVDAMFSKPISLCVPRDTSVPLHYCLHVYSALSQVLLGIRLHFHSLPPAELVEKIEKEMVSLLEAKQGKAFEAIWSTLEENMNRVLKLMQEYSSGTQTPQGSSDIHKATCSVMDHINVLLCNHSTLSELVSKAASLGKYVPQTGHEQKKTPLISLIAEMVSCLEEKLITKSQLFPDQGLRFLFLLNNSNFILEHLIRNNFIQVDVTDLTRKVEDYIESYIQVSWAPMLSYLFNPTPLWLGRNHSPLSKFESEFHKIYTTQKLWKVPDPGLRKRLRRAVNEKIIPGYTEYIEDSKVTNPIFTPQELEEMLQELFEG